VRSAKAIEQREAASQCFVVLAVLGDYLHDAVCHTRASSPRAPSSVRTPRVFVLSVQLSVEHAGLRRTGVISRYVRTGWNRHDRIAWCVCLWANARCPATCPLLPSIFAADMPKQCCKCGRWEPAVSAHKQVQDGWVSVPSIYAAIKEGHRQTGAPLCVKDYKDLLELWKRHSALSSVRRSPAGPYNR
jgi:hypothetical protein